MVEKKQHIDTFFRKRLSYHESAPPPEVWRKINARLSERKRSGTINFVIRIAAAVIILLGLGGGLIHIFRQDTIRDNYLPPDKMVISPIPETADMPAPGHPPLITDMEPVTDIKEIIYEDPYIVTEKRESIPDLKPGIFLTKEKIADFILSEPAPSITPGEIPYVKPVMNLKEASERHSPAYSETDRTGHEPKRRWTASIMVAPNYSYRTLSEKYNWNTNTSRYNNFESGLFGFSGSIAIRYIINDRLSLQSGMTLVKSGQSIPDVQVIRNPSHVAALRNAGKGTIPANIQPVDNSLGIIYSSEASLYLTDNQTRILENFTDSIPVSLKQGYFHDRGTMAQGLYYLQAPVLFSYRLISGNTDLVVSGGLGVNYLVGNKVMLKYREERINIGQTGNINSFAISGIIAMGLEREISNNIYLKFEPRYSHFITPANKEGSFFSRPYSLSFFSGLSYRF